MGKKNKSILAVSLFALVATTGVAYLSSGFQKWDLGDWKDKVTPNPSTPSTSEGPIDNRANLVVFNLESEVQSRELNDQSAVTFINSTTDDPIIESVGTYDSLGIELGRTDLFIYKTFEDGYLKFGSSSALGFVGFEFLDDYQFNAIKVTASNYGALNNLTGIFSSDNSGLKVNGHDFGLLPTNAEDTTVAPAREELTHYFTSMQDDIYFETYGKRVFIHTIELWTDETQLIPDPNVYTNPEGTTITKQMDPYLSILFTMQGGAMFNGDDIILDFNEQSLYYSSSWDTAIQNGDNFDYSGYFRFETIVGSSASQNRYKLSIHEDIMSLMFTFTLSHLTQSIDVTEEMFGYTYNLPQAEANAMFDLATIFSTAEHNPYATANYLYV